MASVKATLRQYWQAPADETADTLAMADWLSALEDWPIADVQDALRQWVMDNPSRRPNYGHIAGMLKARRGREWAERLAPQPVPARDPVSKDAAAEIMARAGFAPRKMGWAE